MLQRIKKNGLTSNRGSKGIKIEAAYALREALIGVKVMHDGDWLHSDLKPANIGLFDKPYRSVPLDLGSSKQILTGSSLKCRPGTAGTIGYLAPELELEDYDHSIDIWAMGVILYELTYDEHPWRFSINPWRKGRDYEALRSSFKESYRYAANRMVKDYSSARASPTSGYIHCQYPFRNARVRYADSRSW